jgi:carboxymethylenebutenolidase
MVTKLSMSKYLENAIIDASAGKAAMTGHWIEVESSKDDVFPAYLTRPPRGSGPGLLLCHDVSGIDADLRALADRLAEEGYVVIVPDLLRAIAQDDTLKAAVRDLEAAAAALRDDSACKGGLGVLGYGRGGTLAVLAAAAGHVDCAVGYDAPGLEGDLDELRRIRVPIALHLADADRSVSPPALDVIRGALGAAEIYRYAGVSPGFAAPASASCDKPASDMAYSRTIALLRRAIGPRFDLDGLWEAHRGCEFVIRDADETMKTMVAEPYVNHVPTMTGGSGQTDLRRFYHHHFIHSNPKDMKNIPISRTVGADRVVNEGILCFTHDTRIDWLLPGVEPTGKYVEVALIGIITFRGDKLVHEHIYWDQASVLVQIGLLDPRGLPVAGVEAARKVLNPDLPSNGLLPNWADSAPPAK